MYTQHHPCWDAKNRYGLPDEVDFDYSVIAGIISGSQAAASTVPEARPSAQIPPVEPSTQQNPAPVKQENSGQMAMDLSGGSAAQATAASAPPEAPRHELDERIPKALRDLMAANNVDDAMLRHAVFQRGCYPEAMPVAKYAPELVANIVGKWPQWLQFIQDNSDVPF